jgi:Ca2+-transporting ATPase
VNSLIYIFAYRSMRQSLPRMNSLRHNMPLVWAVLGGLVLVALPFAVPALGTALGIVPLNWVQWLLIAGVALSLLLVVEIGKAINNKVRARRAAAFQRGTV